MHDPIVFCQVDGTAVDAATGLKIRLVPGEAWAADDPFVKANPDKFSLEPPTIRRTVARVIVEQASKAPGEKRATKRG